MSRFLCQQLHQNQKNSWEPLNSSIGSLWETMNSCMIKSNIINWLSCNQTGGSIMEEGEDGPIKCKVIKVVSTDYPQCQYVTPTEVAWNNCGFLRRRPGYFHYYIQFDIKSDDCDPTWDPCGEGSNLRYIKGVHFPHGNVYIR
ncbi:unnamed protein product [Owenia fusiformis]|uniref:Uncharacterized protein n=1 Tax=Owenia fusiformis TaxID=6347 RepID=A0A8S4P616_OWEFU|nr:unnamed protein product [Owenia fusiformis]